MQIFTQHSYVPETILTDKGTTFTSQLLNSLMASAGIKIEHASVKHAQTIGMVERSHQKLKQILKINISADSPQWHKYVNLAVMAHNTTYHQAIRCTPTEVFHGRVPFNALDVKFGNPLFEQRNTTDVTGILDNMNKKFQQTHDNIIEAFHKHKTSPLKVNDFTFLLNKRLSQQSEKFHSRNSSGKAHTKWSKSCQIQITSYVRLALFALNAFTE